MGKTYKDREKVGRPRIPEWARPKPTIPHKDKRKDDETKDWREELYDETYGKD